MPVFFALWHCTESKSGCSVLPDRPPSSNHAKHRRKSAKLGFCTLHGCSRVWLFEILRNFWRCVHRGQIVVLNSEHLCGQSFENKKWIPPKHGRQKKVPFFASRETRGTMPLPVGVDCAICVQCRAAVCLHDRRNHIFSLAIQQQDVPKYPTCRRPS